MDVIRIAHALELSRTLNETMGSEVAVSYALGLSNVTSYCMLGAFFVMSVFKAED